MLLWRVFLADLADQFYLTWCCPLQLAAISNAISILWRYLSGERFLAASLVMGCCLSTLLHAVRVENLWFMCQRFLLKSFHKQLKFAKVKNVALYTIPVPKPCKQPPHPMCVRTSWSPPPMAGPDKNPRDIDSCNKPCIGTWKYNVNM